MSIRNCLDHTTNLGILGWGIGQACDTVFKKINVNQSSQELTSTQANIKTVLKIIFFLGDLSLCTLFFPIALYVEVGFFVLRNIISFALTNNIPPQAMSDKGYDSEVNSEDLNPPRPETPDSPPPCSPSSFRPPKELSTNWTLYITKLSRLNGPLLNQDQRFMEMDANLTFLMNEHRWQKAIEQSRLLNTYLDKKWLKK